VSTLIEQLIHDGAGAQGNLLGAIYENGQGFTLDAEATITEIGLYIVQKGLFVGDLTVRIETSDGGDPPIPSGTLANVNATKDATPVDATWVGFVFNTSFILSASTLYYIVIYHTIQDENKYCTIGRTTPSAYAGGNWVRDVDNWGWNTFTDYDLAFYVKGTVGQTIISPFPCYRPDLV
jgi:hypothetical protein